jgi:hypothetical protein
MPEDVRAVCFPHEDDAFAAHVRGLLDEAPDEGPIWAAVEALLRESYPMALISPRIGMASTDPGIVWYVYRDGTFRATPAVDAE